MYALLGAMDAELRSLVEATTVSERIRWNGSTLHLGVLDETEVLICRVGVGKVLSAILTQRIIDTYSPESIVLCGIAGALNRGYDIGDLVVAYDCLQHDLDVTTLGFARGEVPYAGMRIFRCDEDLVSAATGYVPHEGTVHAGRVVTGDQFVGTADKQSHRYLVDELGGDAVDMEGAAVGLTATLNSVPFLILRVISDRADGKAAVSFGEILSRASELCAGAVRHVLATIG